MTAAKPRSFTLAPEQVRYVDGLVESGRFATDVEVVAAGLEALRDADAEFEQWILAEAVPVMIALEEDPARAIPADQVFASLKARGAER